ncbi:MAG: abortive infection family protein [Actinomycetota bacterium]
MKKIRANAITSLTRRNILDYLSMENVAWAGRLDEPGFVVRVWPDAGTYRSTDNRYKDALADIWQHRINNYDWDDDWIFTDTRFNLTGCDDPVLLTFLAEMVHPVVRPDADEVTKLVTEFNTHLRPDGYQLTEASSISGRPIYAGTRITASHTPATALKLPTRTLLDDHTALQDHLNSIQRTISTDPAATIASAKELVETTFKLILDKRGVAYKNGDDLGDLYKKVATELSLTRDSVPGSAKGSEAAKKTLGALNTAVFGLAELRNTLGRGHGRTTVSPALERHARLAFNTAVALTEFLFDTWQEREKNTGP